MHRFAKLGVGLGASAAGLASLSLTLSKRAATQEEAPAHKAGQSSKILFMGTGTSSSTPHLDCVMGLRYSEKGGCAVCSTALKEGPTNKNWRGNPSMLVMYNGGEDDKTKYIQFDAGKTFLETAKRFFPKHDIPNLDAVVLTHEHADAVFGLDDLRLVQKYGTNLDIFLSWQCFLFCKASFPYLVKSNPIPDFQGAGKHIEIVAREALGESSGSKPGTFVASLKWNVISTPSLSDSIQPFKAAGLEITPFPVYHGKDFLSLGFAFGKTNRKFVYISDVSEVPKEVMELLKEWEIEYLVIDTLHPKYRYPTHMSLEESLVVIEELAPKKTFLVGVSHQFDHDVSNKELAELKETKNLDVQIAFDGMVLDLGDLEI